MNVILSETDRAKQRDVVTLCDYGTCPTIKSNNAVTARIVVKSDEKFQSIEARTSHSNNGHNESLETHTLGVPLL